MGDSPSAIANLLFTYGALVDDGDFEGIGRLFEHAVIRGEGTDLEIRGAEAVTGLYRATTRIHPETGTTRTRHLITNLVIEVDEATDRAHCRSCYTVLQQTETLPLQPIVCGRYHSSFERAEGSWRFASHRFFVDMVGDVSQHLLIDLGAGGSPPRPSASPKGTSS